MIKCVACERDRHDCCSAQVPAANAPCACEHCWGIGGSVAFYDTIAKATAAKGNSAAEEVK